MIRVPDTHPLRQPCFLSETLVGETQDKSEGQIKVVDGVGSQFLLPILPL